MPNLPVPDGFVNESYLLAKISEKIKRSLSLENVNVACEPVGIRSVEGETVITLDTGERLALSHRVKGVARSTHERAPDGNPLYFVSFETTVRLC